MKTVVKTAFWLAATFFLSGALWTDAHHMAWWVFAAAFTLGVFLYPFVRALWDAGKETESEQGTKGRR